MHDWIVPLVALVVFIVGLVPASRFVQRRTGRGPRLRGLGFVTLIGGLFVLMMLLGRVASIGRPWGAVAAAAVAGIWGLFVEALLGERTS